MHGGLASFLILFAGISAVVYLMIWRWVPARNRRAFGLYFLIPQGMLVLFRFESGWPVIAAVAVITVAAVLGMALWAESGFTRIDLRDLRIFFRRESWGLGPRDRP